jgi:hypothetical protein
LANSKRCRASRSTIWHSAASQYANRRIIVLWLSASVPNNQLQDQLKRFWKIENCEPKKRLAIEEQHFSDTTLWQPDSSNKTKSKSIGRFYCLAVKRFYCLERKPARYPTFKQDYTAFIDEYLNLNLAS